MTELSTPLPPTLPAGIDLDDAGAIDRLKDEGMWIAGADMEGKRMDGVRMEGAVTCNGKPVTDGVWTFLVITHL